jgi:hypothetical protein
MREFSYFPINYPLDKIKRRLKIPLPSNLLEYNDLIERFYSLIEPMARFEITELSVDGNNLLFNDGYSIQSKSLSSHLKGCNRATLLGLTIGPFIEEEIEKFTKKKKSLEPLILDAVGSECAEEAAIYISGIINEEIKQAHCLPTKRFSPGYGDLSLDVQRWFFQNLKLEEIGMRLNESMLMIPQKSITAFIGWRKNK